MHRIVMRVMQAGEIAFLKRQVGFPIVMPNFATFQPIQLIEIASHIRVQVFEECSERHRCPLPIRTVSYIIKSAGRRSLLCAWAMAAGGYLPLRSPLPRALPINTTGTGAEAGARWNG